MKTIEVLGKSSGEYLSRTYVSITRVLSSPLLLLRNGQMEVTRQTERSVLYCVYITIN